MPFPRRSSFSKAFLPSLMFGLSLLPVIAAAELEKLNDGELSEIDGAGIGLILEDFIFSHGTDAPDVNGEQARIFRIAGIQSTDGREVDITVNHRYIAGSDSDYGTNLTPMNLGRLLNPWRIDVVDGNDIGITNKAVLEFAAPALVDAAQGYDCLRGSAAVGGGTCSSRPATQDWQGERADMGMQMNVAVGDDRSANLNLHARSAVIDGSYLRLWGDDERRQMAGEFRLNFYSPELTINACSQDGSNCGSSIVMSDFVLQLALGNRLQPIYFDVDGSGNFLLEIDTIDAPGTGQIAANGQRAGSDAATWDFYNDYYSNPEFRSNVHGTAILLNDIHTSDGGDFDGVGQDDNTCGIRTDLAVDVYPTRVIRTVDGVKRVEHPLGFAVQTAVYGAVLQNVDIRANLTAMPIP